MFEFHLSRLEVHDAQGAERIAFTIDQRHPCVEFQKRLAAYERQLFESLIERQVGNDQNIVAANGMRAAYRTSRNFGDFRRQAVFCLEPALCFLDDVHESYRRSCYLRRQIRQLIIAGLGRRAKSWILPDGLDPLSFIFSGIGKLISRQLYYGEEVSR